MGEKRSVVARIIINVAGKPKEHVEKAMKIVVENIQKEKQISIIKRKMMKAQKKEEAYFSAVAELEIECDNPAALVGFCLDYLPSSVEIIEPEEINLDSMDLASLLNDLLSKMHNASLNVGQMKSENELLKQNGEHLLKNIIMLSIRENPKTIEEMAGDIGIKPESLQPFVEKYVSLGNIEKKGDKYRLKKGLY
jgi:hypothetical protein